MKGRFLIAFMLLTILMTAAACSKTLRTDAPMTGFSFSHSGMHTGFIYTLSAARTESGWQADLSLLAGEQEYEFHMTEEEAGELTGLVKAHELNRWNGFDKVDRSALDGYSFEMTIDYEDGQHLYASGSNTFPKGYNAAHEAILKFFGELMEKNGIENPF